jgi:hypothetical protein
MTALLCLSLIGWSILPSLTHVPRIAETLHDHARMIADHGHSHGFQVDLRAALHSHSQDAIDHDHSPALAVAAASSAIWPAAQDALRLQASQSDHHSVFRIERPPRA